MNELSQLGWTSAQDAAWAELNLQKYRPGRVIADYGTVYKVAMPAEVLAAAAGRLLHRAESSSDFPKVGDWVAVEDIEPGQGIIQALMPRTSSVSRRRPGGKLEKQVMAANVDIAFLVQALDADFSPERLRRYLLQLSQEHITPIVILNKSDLSDDIEQKSAQMTSLGVRVIVTSARENHNIAAVAAEVKPGQTAVFLGSSGVGKSTITNALLGEQRQATKEVRALDSKGRHTTTHRELFQLPGGGLLIDTPGIRELQLWGTEASLEQMFPDIIALELQCRYTNCSHGTEAGCAIQAAVTSGQLGSDRLQAYRKLQVELQELAVEIEAVAAQNQKLIHKRAQRAPEETGRTKLV